jgi:hypothetical protein
MVRWLRWALAGLWISAGLALLFVEWWQGPALALPIGDGSIRLAWICFVVGGWNILRAFAERRTESADWIQRRRRRNTLENPPNPRFRFDEDESEPKP